MPIVNGTSGRWWEREPDYHCRKALPQPIAEEKAGTLWSIVKNAIGKDLRKLPLPVEFLEPLSDPQKVSENCCDTHLCDQAFQKPKGSMERHLLVAAFAVAPYSSAKRARKPFYAMLGETYELTLPEQRVRFLVEEVSRDPDIAIARMEGQNWVVEIDAEPVPKFMGVEIDIHLNWDIRLTFADGDCFAWSTLITSVNNLTGNMYVLHHGAMHVANKASGRTAVMAFGEPGNMATNSQKSRKNKNLKVIGHIEENGKKLASPTISGQWDDTLTANLPNGSEWQLWSKKPDPADPSRFGFSTFAMAVNDIPKSLAPKLPPTDSRHRKDLRLLEQGDNAQATKEKSRLEAVTSSVLADLKASKQPIERAYPAKWFEKVPDAGPKGTKGKFGAIRWQYKGGYWEARESGNFGPTRDVFGNGSTTI